MSAETSRSDWICGCGGCGFAAEYSRCDVVAEQDALVADIESAAGDDRVRPTVLLAALGRIEPALFAAVAHAIDSAVRH